MFKKKKKTFLCLICTKENEYSDQKQKIFHNTATKQTWAHEGQTSRRRRCLAITSVSLWEEIQRWRSVFVLLRHIWDARSVKHRSQSLEVLLFNSKFQSSNSKAEDHRANLRREQKFLLQCQRLLVHLFIYSSSEIFYWFASEEDSLFGEETELESADNIAKYPISICLVRGFTWADLRKRTW